jgi:hypothetical protein
MSMKSNCSAIVLGKDQTVIKDKFNKFLPIAKLKTKEIGKQPCLEIFILI